MYTVAIFSAAGVLLYKKSSTKEEAPLQVFNDAISAQIQGKPLPTGTYSVKIVQNHSLRISCAVAYPSIVSVQAPEQLASDLLKIYSSLHEALADGEDVDIARFQELADLRMNEKLEEKVEEKAELDDAETPRAGTPSYRALPKVNKGAKKSKKQARKWDGTEEDNGTVLDYSEPPNAGDLGPHEQINSADLGQHTTRGFEVKTLEDELQSILSSTAKSEDKKPGRFSLSSYVGGKKLTDADLNKALATMEDRLVAKNVTKEISHKICQQVREDLIGVTTSSWTSVNASVQASMSRILSKTLTPNTSNDLLLDIRGAKANGRPYVMSIVGVNGVGKSTNLGKIAFWLLQNNFKVLIAACDTFRSGAVEQLGVHVKRLQQLVERQEAGKVELFDQGYGKDAAVIAKKAVEYGQRNQFDIVLIDTAGRRHNDQRLMSSLEKFGKLANPDKIIMVGEALVGTDSVQQALNFNAAFGQTRNIDFFLISKCDTVGEMLGTLVNMTSSTGIPVLFVGVGQNYTDLRTLSVDWAVNLLLS